MMGIIAAARDLRSDGSNPEYDKALVELTAAVIGCGTDSDRYWLEGLIFGDNH